MRTGLIAQKLGMSRVFTDEGNHIPVTVLRIDNCQVVAQRTREIGLRLALGAQKANILNLVLRRAILLVSAGVACGTVAAWFAVSLARSYIFGVQAHDGLTFSAVVAVLAAASLIAAWIPARHAASIEPIVALRSE